jgi:hypothetical protein
VFRTAISVVVIVDSQDPPERFREPSIVFEWILKQKRPFAATFLPLSTCRYRHFANLPPAWLAARLSAVVRTNILNQSRSAGDPLRTSA